MVNYQNSKIYKIIDIGGNMCYIGSTTKDYLSKRMTEHRNHYSQWLNGKPGNVSAFQIFDTYGVENCRIELIELCPCNSRDELRQREGHYIRNLLCVNKVIPDRTKQQYRLDNALKLKTRQALYRDEHREKLNELKKVSIKCSCGVSYTHSHKSRHFQTKAHNQYIAENPIDG